MLLERLVTNSQETPDKPFLVLWQSGKYRIISFLEFLNLTKSVAAFLDNQLQDTEGVVFIVLKHHPLLHALFVGCMLKSLIPSYLPFPTPKQDHEIYFSSHEKLFERTRPAAIITYGELIDNIRRIAPPGTPIINVESYAHEDYFDLARVNLKPTSIALLQHSSGTTGLKKGVELTFEQIALQTDSYAKAVALTRESSIVSWLPLYHDMGLLTSFLIPLAIGSSVVSLDAFEWVKEPDLLLKVIDIFKCSHTWLPNFAFNHIVNATDPAAVFDLSSMHSFISCSEPAKPATMRLFTERFGSCGAGVDKLQACYAMAETVFAVTQYPLDRPNRITSFETKALRMGRPVLGSKTGDEGTIELVSNGCPIPGIEVGILCGDGRIALENNSIEIGEIVVRGCFVFTEYYRNNSTTADAFSHGWYKTGDIGFMFESELYICGRNKDLVIVHGRNYYTHDIEEIASAVPQVIPGRVVAIGVPDSVTGSEEVLLLVETQLAEHDIVAHQALRREIKRAIFDRLEFMPREVHFVPSGWLVKTTSGKISRVDNLSRFREKQPRA